MRAHFQVTNSRSSLLTAEGTAPLPLLFGGAPGSRLNRGVLVKKEKVETLSCPFIFFNF